MATRKTPPNDPSPLFDALGIDEAPTPAPKPLTGWEKEWQGMPEYFQGEVPPHAQIIVRFASQEALDDFAAKIGQPLSADAKSIWHPKLIRGVHSAKRWVDEEP